MPSPRSCWLLRWASCSWGPAFSRCGGARGAGGGGPDACGRGRGRRAGEQGGAAPAARKGGILMLAAVFEAEGRLSMEERPLPVLASADDILIAVEACGIC